VAPDIKREANPNSLGPKSLEVIGDANTVVPKAKLAPPLKVRTLSAKVALALSIFIGEVKSNFDYKTVGTKIKESGKSVVSLNSCPGSLEGILMGKRKDATLDGISSSNIVARPCVGYTHFVLMTT
jgi:hypothetical protein